MQERINVTRSSMPEFEEYCAEIRELWDTRWLTNMGKKHLAFQEKLMEYLGAEHVELLTNGHMALELTIQAMGFPRGGEVITTPYTFASTTHAIVRNGLTPVFCDINPDDFTIDVTKVEGLINDRTCAILPVHVYGNMCNVEEISRIARKYELKVIYDAAHVFGVRYKGIGAGCFGDASCFSFHATKVFHSIEGGAVVFSDSRLGEMLYDLKNFGIHGPEEVSAVGANAKMNEFCAAMGLCNLRHIDEEIRKRKRVSDLYRVLLSDVEGLRLNAVQENVETNNAYFPIVIDEKKFGATREEVFEALEAENIGARKYFYPITNSFSAFHGRFDVAQTPIALHISKRVLTLPIYAELCEEDVRRISDIVLSCRR